MRKFPLVGLEGEPDYSVNLNVFEPNRSHPPYYDVEFSSNESAEEIITKVSEYLRVNKFKFVEKKCPNSNSPANCSTTYAGKASIMEISINLKKPIDERNLTETNSIRVEETFIDDIEEYKRDLIRAKESERKAKEENRCSENERVKNFSQNSSCISKNIGEFPLVGLLGNPTYDSDILLGRSKLSFRTSDSANKIVDEGKKYLASIGFKVINEVTITEFFYR